MILSEEELMIQDTARRFAAEQLTPTAAQRDQDKQFPKAIMSALGELGFLGMLVPDEYDGVEVSFTAYALAMEEIAAGDGACSTIMGVHNSVGTLPILQFGSESQKQTFLKPLARGEQLAAFCLTEPQAGSDAANLRTTAVRKDDHFVLNGVKQFITSGADADIAIVFAVTDPSAGKKGISAFIVPTQLEGYEVTRIEDKMGQHASVTAQITLDNLKLPADHLLGDAGQGYKIALQNLACGRIGIAAQSVGMARAALDAATQYAKERESFGKPIIEHQVIQFRLADMKTNLEAAHQMVIAAAKANDAGKPDLTLAAMAKLFASETAEKICRDAIQVFGGYGYLQDFPVERIYRDVRVASIYEGTSDVQRMIIGKSL